MFTVKKLVSSPFVGITVLIALLAVLSIRFFHFKPTNDQVLSVLWFSFACRIFSLFVFPIQLSVCSFITFYWNFISVITIYELKFLTSIWSKVNDSCLEIFQTEIQLVFWMVDFPFSFSGINLSWKYLACVWQRLFSAEELALYNGTDDTLPILLGILGYFSHYLLFYATDCLFVLSVLKKGY